MLAREAAADPAGWPSVPRPDRKAVTTNTTINRNRLAVRLPEFGTRAIRHGGRNFGRMASQPTGRVATTIEPAFSSRWRGDAEDLGLLGKAPETLSTEAFEAQA